MKDLAVIDGKVPSVRQEPTTGELIAQAIANPSVDPARLTAFLEFKLRVDAIEAEKEFNRDFAAAMQEMPHIVKRGVIDMGAKGKMAFATYEDIDTIIRPIEQRYGFARTFSTEPSKDGITVTLVLMHRSGHSIKSTRFMPPDTGAGRNGMQATGSAESYAKRYLTNGVWNLVTVGQDNDGTRAEPITQEQIDQVRDLLAEIGSSPNDARFLKWLRENFNGVDSIGRIQQPQFHDVMRGLEQRRRTA